MTPRERFISALECKPEMNGESIPHFELVFFLTMEVFGKVHPTHREYSQWNQMEKKEQDLHIKDMANLYIQTAERYGHSAIFMHSNPGTVEVCVRTINEIRSLSGDKYFLMMHGDATCGLPSGDDMVGFSCRLADEPDKVKDESKKAVENALLRAEEIKKDADIDGFALCSDYCFNSGPFLSPTQFGEFVAPFLNDLISGYRDLDYYTIKHTDGNIMPILDMLIESNPHALHSIDPQGGVELPEVIKRVQGKIALIGNVNCGLLQTGSDIEAEEDVRRSIREGQKYPGYIFSTSNCVYTGLALERYENMVEIWKKEGVYKYNLD